LPGLPQRAWVLLPCTITTLDGSAMLLESVGIIRVAVMAGERHSL
jgi:hypothetical protein